MLIYSGKILSGGQKARVSLARAVYSRASIILLDDVMSAVDAQTSKHIIEHCFSSPLMAGRTVIIASHAVEALAPLAHHSVFLDDGKAVWTGPGKDLLESEHMKHLKTESKWVDFNDADVSEKDASIAKNEKIAISGANNDKALDSRLSDRKSSISSESADKKDKDKFEIKEAFPKTPKQLLLEEGRDTGTIEFRHWRDLKRFNGTNLFWTGAIFLLIVGALLPVIEKSVLE